MILVTICHCRVITELLTIVPMLYTISMWGIYNWKFVPLISFNYSTSACSSNTLSSGNHQNCSLNLWFCFFFFLDHRNKWNHTVFVFLWLISCSIILWVQPGCYRWQDFIFIYLSNIPLCINIYIYIYTYQIYLSLTVANNAVQWTWGCTYFRISVFILFG